MNEVIEHFDKRFFEMMMTNITWLTGVLVHLENGQEGIAKVEITERISHLQNLVNGYSKRSNKGE